MAPEPLDPAVTALVRLSAALGSRHAERVHAALSVAAAVAEHGAVDEVILQSHLFIGFPDALAALARWRHASGAPAPADADDDADWTERGRCVCARVYGDNYEKLRANVAALHPAMDGWMVTGGYGRVLGRAGLALPVRELCIAALLVVWGAPRQLHSHLRGALNAGATRAQVDEAVRIASELAEPAAAGAARELWSELRDRYA